MQVSFHHLFCWVIISMHCVNLLNAFFILLEWQYIFNEPILIQLSLKENSLNPGSNKDCANFTYHLFLCQILLSDNFENLIYLEILAYISFRAIMNTKGCYKRTFPLW